MREARRAVFDALPILAAAKEVTIAEIPEQDGRRADALSHVADVAAWLRGHGIAAHTVVPEKAGDVTEQTREDRRQCRSGRRGRRCLRPLAIPRMGAQWRYAPPCNGIATLRVPVPLGIYNERGLPVHKFLEATAGQYMTRTGEDGYARHHHARTAQDVRGR